ncbi:Leucine-rich repeat-containing protein 58 [Amphibalanus amphitrite]|uniref:Leucine-rich repeat-containing protein 58 n=1 Tax=Amphibalanus amphitrite TaxID=1232801 RepID=A0A6A4X3Z4_AMPAM|nr:leucine-rich repeat-containing protein 58-like [Amphibalanus amphitrite]XP_043201149.1 leucine-rich repeat-containing protein 58-like [Amphibalanus amphitrite]KAF0309568.1 Leucine-rich repeat-containing protein 58 [Amphibalanus amphitrite]
MDIESVYSAESVYSSEASDSELLSMLTSVTLNGMDLDGHELHQRLAEQPPSQRAELEAVHAANNRLTRLPTLLPAFPALRMLNLSHNQLTEVSDAILALPALTNLVLKHNDLGNASLPKDFGLLRHLRELNISGNNFTQVPPQVLELANLSDLYMASNQLECVPENIHRLQRLRVLQLGGNNLTSVPATLGNLTILQVLVLCDNRLTELPESICSLPRLRTLLLHANQLSTLPGSIVRLRALKQLSLRDNPLVRDFVGTIEYEPSSLLELAARCVKLHNIPYGPGDLPAALIEHLASAKHCVNKRCKGVFFDTRVEDVQFVDFCGMYHIPLMRYLCSSNCERLQVTERGQRSDESDSDDEVGGWRQRRLRRVLLG